MEAIDFTGDPDIVAKIADLARSEGLTASEPMGTDSTSDALDAPFGAEEIRQVCDVVTIVMGASTSVVGFLAAVKALLKRSETSTGEVPSVEVRRTRGQKQIGTIRADTEIASLAIS